MVGAYFEAGLGTGVGADPTDNRAQPMRETGARGGGGQQGQAGAAYLFERSGDTWIQTAYLKAPNTDPGDRFGLSLSPGPAYPDADIRVLCSVFAEEGGGWNVLPDAGPLSQSYYLLVRNSTLGVISILDLVAALEGLQQQSGDSRFGELHDFMAERCFGGECYDLRDLIGTWDYVTKRCSGPKMTAHLGFHLDTAVAQVIDQGQVVFLRTQGCTSIGQLVVTDEVTVAHHLYFSSLNYEAADGGELLWSRTILGSTIQDPEEQRPGVRGSEFVVILGSRGPS